MWIRPDITHVKIEKDLENLIRDIILGLESIIVCSKIESGNEKLISAASPNSDIISNATDATVDDSIQLDTVNSIIQNNLSKHPSIKYKSCMKELRKRLSSQKV